MNKLLAFGVILLFLIIACSPSIVADESIEQQANNIIYSQDDKLISLPVREYKPDGTIYEYFVELTQSQYDEMTKRLQTAKNLDERLSIYKDYNVVPEDVTSESLRAGMEEKARRFGLNEKMEKVLKKRSTKHTPIGVFNFHWNFYCDTVVSFWYSIFPAIGTSFLTARLNYLLLWLDPYGQYEGYFTKDLITLCAGMAGSVMTQNGVLDDFILGVHDYNISLFNGFVLMVGFVGFAMAGLLPPFRICIFVGSSYFVIAHGNE